jgi:amino acid adenylation domain-containing protein
MIEYIERSFSKYPDAPALVLGSHTCTYSDIESIAKRWASVLIEAADGKPKRVGVLGYRSKTSYLGALACMFAGAAFVPLNPRFPLDRTRRMIELADLDAIFVDGATLPKIGELLEGLPKRPAILTPDTRSGETPYSTAFDADMLGKAAPVRNLPSVQPEDNAYLLFTSGSTGQPKGVAISYANLKAFLDTNLARYELGPGDRLSQTFDQTFDLSVFDLFMAWASGACVVSMQPIELLAPASFINKHRITVWFSVPSLVAIMQKNKFLKPGSMPSLRWSLFCGEALLQSTAEAWQEAAPNSILENLYGPTELTIACSAYRWDPTNSPRQCVNGIVPIGQIYPGLEAVIVDENKQILSKSAKGELCVTGPQTFGGYWRAPELTEAQMITHADSKGRTVGYYRTGDIVQLDSEGNYIYHGRRDHQVKLNGYRIELAEIEAMLRKLGCVEAVALPWPAAQNPEKIIAFVSGAADGVQVCDALRQRLPAYMIPAQLHVVPAMPLTPNGKIDRNALKQMLDHENETASTSC